jgi:DNA polymerase-3 subunit epsilon
MREIVLDTETTGLNAFSGDRIVEIGCVELMHHLPTGAHFHRHINPQRAMSADAERVHGLSDAFLADKPTFAEIVDDFLAFIGDAPLVIHNAEFDIGFLNAELGRLGLPPLRASRVVDSLAVARRTFPGAQASLDALCRRFGVDNSNRTFHGALLDCQLLAEVWLELRGGREPGLALAAAGRTGAAGITVTVERLVRPPRPHAPTPEELAAHAAFIATLGDAIWLQA